MTSFSVVPWCYKLSNKNESTVKLFNISMVKQILCGTICMRCLLFTLTKNVWNDVKTTLLLQNWVEKTTFWNIFLSYKLLVFNRKQKEQVQHFGHDFINLIQLILNELEICRKIIQDRKKIWILYFLDINT